MRILVALSILILAAAVLATAPSQPNAGPTYQQVVRVTYTTNFWNVTNRYSVTNMVILTNAQTLTVGNLIIQSATVKSWKTN